MKSRARRILSTLVLAAAFLAPASTGRSDDTTLFSAAVPPNVLLFIDNSGSMNEMNWYTAQSATESGWLGFAGYDPTTNYTCSTGHFASNFSRTSDGTWSGRCGVASNRTLYVDAALGGTATRFVANYVRYLWTLSDANYSTLVNATAANGACAQSLGASASYHKYRRSRIISARDIVRNVVCDVNAAGEVRFGLSIFRKAGGSGDPNGGYVLVPVNDWKWDHDSNPSTPKVAYSYTLNGSTKTHQQHLTDAINSLDGESWTPLGETLFQLYTYFMSRSGADNVKGANGTTSFPIYQYVPNETGNGGGQSGAGAPTVPGSPIQYACQKNFIIMVTDGEPTRDDFDTDANTADNTNLGYADFLSLIGDYNPDNALPEGGVAETLTAQNDLFGAGFESATFLDDIAKFAHEKDMRTDLSGVQNIDVYTVGFTTAGATNQILQKAAAAGGGRFYSSSDPSQLDDAIVDAITDIINKAQAFTAATVPASRTTDGNNFYTSYFLPGTGTPFWEGHLKNFDFTLSGQILDSAGNCAIADPGAPTTCETGPLLTTAPAFWDASSAMPGATARTLRFARSATMQNFNTATVTAADLGVTYPPAVAYGGSTAAANGGATNATKAEYLSDEITSYVRGCTFGTGAGSIACTDRPIRLADIFHSNPLVVGPPNSAINDATYSLFAADMIHRKKLIYAGSNGGFLHAFDAGVWNPGATPPSYTRGTGAEEFGFMPYEVRKNIRQLPVDGSPRDYYYVDGPPASADVWFYPTATTAAKAAKTEWHTVLMGGLRQGGRSYYALDVTNPDGLAGYPGFPSYLWEFPCEATSCDGWRPMMGETWSEPIITRVRVAVSGNDNGGQGFERWVAIFGAGYDPKGDPNNVTSYDATFGAGTSRAGRAIVMVDIETGSVLGVKRFSHDPAQGETEMRYAIPSTPAVFDLDADGFADVVYIGDLGGNLWKWVIKAVVEDPIHGTGDVKQPGWPLKKFLWAPSYVIAATGVTHYRSLFFPPTGSRMNGVLTLGFGTGERNDLKYLDDATIDTDNNRIYVVRDADPFEQGVPLKPTIFGEEPDVIDLTTLTSCSLLSGYYGYYLNAIDQGEKFITNSVIFLGYLFTGSFVPNTTTDPCASGGDAYLYGLRLMCGEDAFVPPGDPPGPRRKKVGKGIPNRPRASVGQTGGGGGGGCANQLLVVTSDGSAYNKSAGCLPSSGMNIDTWRELK
jgi:type IV pilus assembly protein PilY1